MVLCHFPPQAALQEMQFALAETLQMRSLVKVTTTWGRGRGLILQGEHEDLPPQGRWRYHTCFFLIFFWFSLQCLQTLLPFLFCCRHSSLPLKKTSFWWCPWRQQRDDHGGTSEDYIRNYTHQFSDLSDLSDLSSMHEPRLMKALARANSQSGLMPYCPSSSKNELTQSGWQKTVELRNISFNNASLSR